MLRVEVCARTPDRNVASRRGVWKRSARRRDRNVVEEFGFDAVTLEHSRAVEFFEAKLHAKGTHP